MKKLIMVIIILILSGCQNASSELRDNYVKLSTQEFDVEGKEYALHIKNLCTEHVLIEYSGDRLYNLVWQKWEDGRVVESSETIVNLQLNDCNGFTFWIEETDSEIELEIGIHGEGGSSMTSYVIEQERNKDFRGSYESKYLTDKEYKEDETLFLWGYSHSRNAILLYEDVYEAVINSEWSLVFALEPIQY